MSRLGYSLLAVITFVGCLALFAPASIVESAVERIPGVSMSNVAGSLWSGSGAVHVGGQLLGTLTYRFKPIQLFVLRAAYDLHLTSPTLDVTALASAGVSRGVLETTGHVDADGLRTFLERYDISIGGRFDTDRIRVEHAWDAPVPAVNGELRWSGAPVSYRLSGVTHRLTLPPLIGFIDSSAGAPEMTVYEPNRDTPLMLARIAADGWATIGITKRFTQLLGKPWAGSDADHAVVLEVQEQLF